MAVRAVRFCCEISPSFSGQGLRDTHVLHAAGVTFYQSTTNLHCSKGLNTHRICFKTLPTGRSRLPYSSLRVPVCFHGSHIGFILRSVGMMGIPMIIVRKDFENASNATMPLKGNVNSNWGVGNQRCRFIAMSFATEDNSCSLGC